MYLASFKMYNVFLNIGHYVTILTALFSEWPKFDSESLDMVN